MKNLTLLFISLLLFQLNLIAQGWEPEVQIVATGFDAEIPQIVAFENNIHVIWEDYRAGANSQIYYKRSTNNGLNWYPGERLSVDPGVSWYSSIAVADSNVYVAWCDDRDHSGSSKEIYFRRSINNGESFDPSQRLTNFVSYKFEADIAVFEDNIHIVWTDLRTNNDVYYMRSIDNGLNWSSELLITQPIDKDDGPKIAVSENNVFIAWKSERGGLSEVYFRRSPDNGISWDPEQKLSSSNSLTYGISITSFDDNIHIAWLDKRTGPTGEIYYKHSFNLGTDWSADKRLTFNALYELSPSLTCFEEKVHLVWADDRDSSYEVYYRKSIDNGVNWDPDMILSTSPIQSWKPSLAAFEENVFAVWNDFLGTSSIDEIIFRRYMSPTSVNDDAQNMPVEYNLAQNYPNPFNPTTKIKYQIPELSFVTLKVFDVLGNEIITLINEEKTSGSYEVEYDATNLPNGVYFYRLNAGNFIETKKMVLLK